MDSDRVNRWLTLGANIGVLIGIILLLVELDQNRDMLRSQTRNELTMGIVGIMSGYAESSELSNIVARARAGETLTPSERLQWYNAQLAMYRYWENVHYQYRMGLYDEEEFVKHKEAWRIVMNRDEATVNVWCERRQTFSSEYAAEMDGLLDKYQCD